MKTERLPVRSAEPHPYDADDDDDTCWQCFGDGGWSSCFEDCCPYEGGEEMCDDPTCWRKCDICGGQGVLNDGD